MNMKGLTPGQKDGVHDALRTLDHTELRFVLVVFSNEGLGSVMSNIEPKDAMKPLEAALKAAKAGCGMVDIEIEDEL